MDTWAACLHWYGILFLNLDALLLWIVPSNQWYTIPQLRFMSLQLSACYGWLAPHWIIPQWKEVQPCLPFRSPWWQAAVLPFCNRFTVNVWATIASSPGRWNSERQKTRVAPTFSSTPSLFRNQCKKSFPCTVWQKKDWQETQTCILSLAASFSFLEFWEQHQLKRNKMALANGCSERY